MDERQQKSQQDFLQKTLDNIQSLIARMDLKAGIVLTIVGLLSPAIYPFVIALFQNCMHIGVRIGVGVILIFYFAFLWFLLGAVRNVFIARPASLGNFSKAPLMIFPLLILNGYKNDKDYKDAALTLSHENIVADYSNQIMECSHIYKQKHEHVNKAIKWLLWLLVPWALFLMVSSGYLLFFGKSSEVAKSISASKPVEMAPLGPGGSNPVLVQAPVNSEPHKNS